MIHVDVAIRYDDDARYKKKHAGRLTVCIEKSSSCASDRALALDRYIINRRGSNITSAADDCANFFFFAKFCRF